jgi:hypothetical protein
MQDSGENTFIQSLKENRKGVHRIYTPCFEGMAVFAVRSYIYSYTPTLTSPAASLADTPTKPYADNYEALLDVSSLRLYRVDGGGASFLRFSVKPRVHRVAMATFWLTDIPSCW